MLLLRIFLYIIECAGHRSPGDARGVAFAVEIILYVHITKLRRQVRVPVEGFIFFARWPKEEGPLTISDVHGLSIAPEGSRRAKRHSCIGLEDIGHQTYPVRSLRRRNVEPIENSGEQVHRLNQIRN